MCKYIILTVTDKRFRNKIFQVWLHPKEYEFLTEYSERNILTASETVRMWIREVMKAEGVEVLEPRNPEKLRQGDKKNGSS